MLPDILTEVAEKNRMDDWLAGVEEKVDDAFGKIEGRRQEDEVENEEEEEENAARGTRRRGWKKVCLIIFLRYCIGIC